MDRFTLDELKLAFGYDLASRVLGSDSALGPEETRFLERAFPPGVLAGAGFLDRSGAFTDRFRRARAEAGRRLPQLDEADRLDLIETIWRAAMVDGVLQEAEGQAIREAATVLGLSAEQVLDRLFPRSR